MIRNFFLLVAFSFLFCQAYAVEWVNLTTPLGKSVALDKDSIVKKDGYYFYNIKYKNAHNSLYTVATIQSGILHQFSARIKFYPLEEYEKLNGDYENITLNKTKNLEAVTYNSVVGTCYREVKKLKATAPSITLN